MVANRSQFDLPSSFSVELHDGIVVLCLSHPKKCNAIDLATLRGIEGFFRELPTAVRAVIIRGGGAHFSVGADLSSTADIDRSTFLSVSRACHCVFDRIGRVHIPVIAVLRGDAVGDGLDFHDLGSDGLG